MNVMVKYQIVLLGSAVVLFGFALPHGVGNPYAVLALAVVAAIAERGRVTLDGGVSTSISVLPTVFAAAVFGPLAAMLVAFSSFLGEFPFDILRSSSKPADRRAGNPLLKWGVYTCIRAIYGALAGFAALGMSAITADGVTQLVIATVTAVIVAETLDLFFAAFTASLRGGPAIEIIRTGAPMVAVSVCLYAPIVAAL